MTTLVLNPLAGAPRWVRLSASLRRLLSRRALLRLAGVDAVVLEGHTYAVRPVPLGIARELVPAVIRCSRRFAEWQIDEALYDDLVKVLALGLGTAPANIERLTIPLWQLAPVIERIAQINGMAVLDGVSDPKKAMAAMMNSTGTISTPPSSPPPAGHGSTSTNA